MKFFKALSICCLIFGLAGCFPGERKVFEEQELQTSKSRADEIAVALADAVQNELTAYFMSQNGADPAAFAAFTALVGGNDGIIRTGRCANGVYAYISADNATIRGLNSLDKGSGMKMVRTLQERFGGGNVGYKSAQGGAINGIENTSGDATCLATIQAENMADGSPVVSLNVGNISMVLDQDLENFTRLSQRVHNCSSPDVAGEGYVGTISKQCTTSYSFDGAGNIQLDQNGFPLMAQNCDSVGADDIALACQVADAAAPKVFSIATGVQVGTDWSAFFQNPGADTPLTIKCVNAGNESSECEPFDADLDPSIIVECSEDAVAPQTVRNPIIQNGIPVSETDASGNIVNRDCGYGWEGELIAEYQTRECKVYRVDPITGENIEHLSDKQTVYQMYYVAAECEKDVEIVEACGAPGMIGGLSTIQRAQMTEPLALHPSNVERGQTSSSRIAVEGEFNSPTNPLPADLQDRIRNQYVLSGSDLNAAEDEAEFSTLLVNEMGNKMSYLDKKCNSDASTCGESVLPPITVALVDRSGSMRSGPQVASTIASNVCRTTLMNAFEDPDEACVILDDLAHSIENCESEYQECLYDNNDQELNNCDQAFEMCGYMENDYIDNPSKIFNELKEEFSDGSQDYNQALHALLNKAISGDYDLYEQPVTCNTRLDDQLGVPDVSGNLCLQSLHSDPFCESACPGSCVPGTSTAGPPVDKIDAVDHALRNILVDQLQYGSTFLYSYFSGEGIKSIKRDIPGCKLIDDPDTTADDAMPLCLDEFALEEEILGIKADIDAISEESLAGSTPLFSTIDDTLDDLQVIVDDRIAQGLPTEIAFYLMTDGIASDSGDYNKICDVATNSNAFSVGLKSRFPSSKLYVLNLPGDAEDCSSYALTVDEPIDLAAPVDPNITVDAYFEFTATKDHFADLFGDTGVVNELSGYESCQTRYEDDDIVGMGTGDGGTTIDEGNGNCPIGAWAQTCLGIDGERYPRGNPMCGPTCLSWDGVTRYLTDSSEGRSNCAPAAYGCNGTTTANQGNRYRYTNVNSLPSQCGPTCTIPELQDDGSTVNVKYLQTSWQCKTDEEKCEIYKDNAITHIAGLDPNYNPECQSDPSAPGCDSWADPRNYITDQDIIDSELCGVPMDPLYDFCDIACNHSP